MTNISRQLHRLFEIYHIDHKDDVIGWIETMVEDEIKRILGPEPDMSTFEGLEEVELVRSYFQAYEANYFERHGKLVLYREMQERVLE